MLKQYIILFATQFLVTFELSIYYRRDSSRFCHFKTKVIQKCTQTQICK